MNKSNILALAFELKQKIVESVLYNDLKEKEKRMLENEESSNLLFSFEKLKDEYKEAKRFEKYGANPVEIQRKMSELKYKLDSHMLIREYNEAYKNMRRELKNIESIIFDDIIEKRKEISIEE